MPLVLDNPILNSYVQGLQMRRQKEQTEFENKQQTAQGQRAQQQLDAYVKNLDSEQKHREAQIELQRNQLSLERQTHELQARQLVGQMMSQGIMKQPTEGQANSSPVGGIQVGDQVIDPRQFATPQDILRQDTARASAMGDVQASTAGKTAGAQATAMQPFQMEQLRVQHAQDLEKQNLVGKQALERTNNEIEGKKAVAKIEGNYGLDKARIMMFGGIGGEGGGDNPSGWSQTVIPYMLGDAQKPLGNTPRDLMIRQHLTAAGFKEFPAKQKVDLQKLAMLDPIVNLQKEFISKYAPDGNIGAAQQILLSKIPTTDLNNFRARLRSAGGTMASTLDAQTGRMANQEIERVLGGLAMPGKTLGQAMQDLNFMRARVSSKALDSIMGDIPDKQKLLILKDIHRDPGEFVTSFQGKEVPRYKQDEQGEWLVFDPSKKGWVSIDAAK